MIIAAEILKHYRMSKNLPITWKLTLRLIVIYKKKKMFPFALLLKPKFLLKHYFKMK